MNYLSKALCAVALLASIVPTAQVKAGIVTNCDKGPRAFGSSNGSATITIKCLRQNDSKCNCVSFSSATGLTGPGHIFIYTSGNAGYGYLNVQLTGTTEDSDGSVTRSAVMTAQTISISTEADFLSAPEPSITP